MKCQWCSRDSEAPFHDECWRQQQNAAALEAAKVEVEAHALIAEIKAGGNPPIPAAVQEEFGKFIAGARAARDKGRGGRGSV